MKLSLQPYSAYLLRLWRVDGSDGLGWRAVLESPRTGSRRGFSDLVALVAFLERQTGETLLLHSDALARAPNTASGVKQKHKVIGSIGNDGQLRGHAPSLPGNSLFTRGDDANDEPSGLDKQGGFS